MFALFWACTGVRISTKQNLREPCSRTISSDFAPKRGGRKKSSLRKVSLTALSLLMSNDRPEMFLSIILRSSRML